MPLIKASMAMGVIQGVTLFLFTNSFPNTKIQLSKKWLLILLAGGTISFINALSPFLFKDYYYQVNGDIKLVPGFGMAIFLIIPFGLVLYTLILLLIKRHRAKGIHRNQLNYISFGLVTTFTLIIFFNFIVVNIFDSTYFVQFGSLWTLPFIFCTAYAITRYRFMDIRVAIRKSVITIVTLVICSVLLVSIIVVLNKLFTKTLPIPDDTITIIGVVILIFFFPTLKHAIRQIVDRLFFRDYIDLSVETQKFQRAIPQEDMVEEIAEKTAQFIQKNFGVDNVWVLVFDHVTRDRLISFWPYRRQIVLPFTEPIIEYCKDKRQIMMREELMLKEQKTATEKSVLRKLEELNTQVAVPYGGRTLLAGLLLLGPKNNRAPYTTNDFDSLQEIAKDIGERIPYVATIQIYNRLAAEYEKNKKLEQKTETK